ncbi:MAG: transcriptional repressor LexA [Clostridia bacterium]|nr:transcriptional repressor LexA [Clostridia bacterium]
MSKNNNKPELLLEFIKKYKTENGFVPSIREMCTALNLSSTSTIFYYINILENQGKIRKTGLKSRAIDVVDDFSTPKQSKIPIVGTVAAGRPILAVENIEDYVSLPDGYFSHDQSNMFVLKVKGDSMIGAGIFEGDELVIKKQNHAENGQIVVALIDDSATVKRFYRENDHIKLVAENPLYAPIIAKDATILGVVSGLMRRF